MHPLAGDLPSLEVHVASFAGSRSSRYRFIYKSRFNPGLRTQLEHVLRSIKRGCQSDQVQLKQM